MKLHEFNKQSLSAQLKVLLLRGAPVAERKDLTNRYVLYQVNRFYVEAGYYLDDKRLPSLNAFTGSGKALDVYLNEINIDELKIIARQGRI